LVYAPLGTPEADNYIDDMSLGANFATVNHMLINALVLEAFQEIIPGTRKGKLVYFISHNIARREIVNIPGMLGASQRRDARFPGESFCAQGHAVLRRPVIRSCCRAIRRQARA
jgi:RNA-splicing ligase RtcB